MCHFARLLVKLGRRAIIGGLCLQILAGATTGKISGQVTDQATGQPLFGANVFIAGTHLGSATDSEGFYMIINIPPGQHTIQFNMIGYRTYAVTEVDVRSDHTTGLDAHLEQTFLETSEAITVSAKKAVIDVDRTSTESSVSGELLKVMPVQDVNDVLNLQAGVVDGHFRGGRSKEVAYLIDGIPVNDVFSSEAALFVENDVIQELKVISGTFNAEYGQAQSGIVEIITRSGTTHFGGSFKVDYGDFFSADDDIYRNIDNINLSAYNEYSLSLQGPLIKKSSFLFSLQNTADEGYLYGRNFFKPSVFPEFIAITSDTNSFTPMQDYQRISLFGKISVPITGQDKISFNTTMQAKERGEYNHEFSYNPRGNSRIKEKSQVSYFTWNHLFNDRTYMDFALSSSDNNFDRYVYENMTDNRYSADNRLRQLIPNQSDADLIWLELAGASSLFNSGGTDMTYTTRTTNTYHIRTSFTGQLNRFLELKMGVDYKQHELDFLEVNIRRNAGTLWEVYIPQEMGPNRQEYNWQPIEGAAYLQTKLESKTLIMNAGIRLDYFDPDGVALDNATRPETTKRQDPNMSWQLSPRFGIAYPISDRGVMHVSYGHFFQIPHFEVLYTNPSFQIIREESTTDYLNHPFGNTELEPQKTVAYEVGIQQQLTSLVSLEATVYYKDIRNLLGSEIDSAYTSYTGQAELARYINSDYGRVKGLTIMLEQGLNNGFGFSLDYTYQVARGNASDPRSVLIDRENEREPEKQMIPLDWDQTHTLNGQIYAQPRPDLTFTLVGKFGSGMPYTPEDREGFSSQFRNSGSKPIQVSFDLFAVKQLKISRYDVQLSAKIYNLLDRRNEKDVYADSGRASRTRQITEVPDPHGWNTLEEFFSRPDWYQSPRQIIVGLSIGF